MTLNWNLIDHGLDELGESTGENDETILVLRCASLTLAASKRRAGGKTLLR